MPNADVDKRDILLSTSRNGEVICNIGEVVDGVGVGADVGMWGVAGFVSMPDVPDPATGQAAQALCLVDGQTKRIIATRDNRLCSKVGEMLPGDCAMVSGGPGRVLVKKAGGVVSIYTELEDGKSMQITLDPPNGQILQSIGKSYIEMKADSITLSCGSNMVRIDSDGTKVFGKAFIADTGAVMLGHFDTPPIAPADSALKGASGDLASPSSSVFIG